MSNLRNHRYPVDAAWAALCRDMDISVQDVLRYAGLPLDLLSRKAPTVSAEEYYRLWEGLAAALKGEPAFPLRLAQTIQADTFSPPIFAALCSADLNMALDRIAYYKPIVGPVRIQLQVDPKQTIVAFEGVPTLGVSSTMPSSHAAFELAFWVQIARIGMRERICPLAVHVTEPLPEIARYEEFFGATVRHDSFDGLTFSAEDASRPFLTANESMWEIFEPELRKRMQDLKQDAPFRERVRAAIVEILASGQYSMSDVASRLAMSSRTLQRRLADENTTFQRVLDELREELARHYLSSSEYSSGQIAFLLGYEEPNSFFRAFRTWTGQTPEYVRANIQ